MFHPRFSRPASFFCRKTSFTGLAALMVVVCFTKAGSSQNLADKMNGFSLGDFESVSSFNGGVGIDGGPIYPGPASSTPGMDSNGDLSNVWSDGADIQHALSSAAYNLSSTSTGATHGSKAVLVNGVNGGAADGSSSTFNNVLTLLNSGDSTQEVHTLINASALKFDITFDRSQFQNPTAGNPFSGLQVIINNPAGYIQGHASYDSLSVQPATSPGIAAGNVGTYQIISSQPNYEPGEYHYGDTSTFPGTDPEATSYSQSPVVTGTGTTTLTVTVDFTTNRQNGVGVNGNGDGGASPLWLLYHNQMVSKYNSVDLSSMTGQTYAQEGGFYNIIQIFYSLGSVYQGGAEFDNFRFIQEGDFNQDGHVDSKDITAAEAALTNLTGYESTHNMTPFDMTLIGDVNGDGKVNNADLQALITELKSGGGNTSTVPEPASFLLLGLGGAFFLARRQGKGK